MSQSPKARWSGLLAVLLLAAPPAHASGFALFEEGAKGVGFAGAFTAQANDPSAIFHNVAGIAFLKGTQMYLGASAVSPKSDFSGSNPFPGAVSETGNAGTTVPPALFFTQQVSENLVLGVGFDTPFGLKTAWQNADTSYSGRFISKQATLKCFSLNPSVAYKLADRLSVGAGVDVRLSSIELDRNVAGIQPFTQRPVDIASVKLTSNTQTGVGFDLGILARPSDGLSIGASYRHSVKVDYAGSAVFTQISTGDRSVDAVVSQQLPAGAIPLTSRIEFPAELSGGIAYTWADWTVEGDVNWYEWSTVQQIPITFTTRPDLSSVLQENYTSTVQYRLGIERRINDQWAVRGGGYYDPSPSPAGAVSPVLPDSDRYGAALGFTYKTGRFYIDAAGLYVFFKDRSTDGQNYDAYNGTYKSSAPVFAVSFGYKF